MTDTSTRCQETLNIQQMITKNLAHIHLNSADGINTIDITLFMHYMLLLETAH